MMLNACDKISCLKCIPVSAQKFKIIHVEKSKHQVGGLHGLLRHKDAVP